MAGSRSTQMRSPILISTKSIDERKGSEMSKQYKVDERSGFIAVYPADEDHDSLDEVQTFANHFSCRGVTFDGMFRLPDEVISQAHIFCAALNTATEVEAMGYDTQKAIEQLPKLLLALEDCASPGCLEIEYKTAKRALAACRAESEDGSNER